MANNEFKLSYTAEDINNKLGKVEEHSKEIDDLTKDIDDKISSLGTVLNYKGSVNTYDDLGFISNPSFGDVYNIIDTNMNYAYTAEGWDSFGTTIDLSGYMPLTGGKIIEEGIDYVEIKPYIVSIVNELSNKSFLNLTNKNIGEYEENGDFYPTYSGCVTLGANDTIDHTFTITAIGVEGNDTAKASWKQWLEVPEAGENVTITDNKINIDLTSIGVSSTFDTSNITMAPNANAIKTFCDENYLGLNTTDITATLGTSDYMEGMGYGRLVLSPTELTICNDYNIDVYNKITSNYILLSTSFGEINMKLTPIGIECFDSQENYKEIYINGVSFTKE